MIQAHANGIRHGIANSRKWRNNGAFTHASNAIGVIGIWNLQNLGINKWQIGTNRDTIIQKASILQTAILTVDIFLV